MKKILKSEETGIISLEACIVIPIFIFIMLWFYSFFILFYAHNVMSNTLVQTAESMSLDPYSYEKLNMSEFPESIVQALVRGFDELTDNNFYNNDWCKSGSGKENTAACERFYAILGDGSENKAKSKLDAMKIIRNDTNFINCSIENGEIHIKLKYKIKYLFDAFNMGKIEMEQEACSKLWIND